MPGSIPGLLGVAAFGGIKFVGYTLAVSSLKKFEPAISAGATKIAAARTALGGVLGPLATLLVVFVISLVVMHPDVRPGTEHPALELPEIYGLLFLIRIFVWAFVLFLFTAKSPLPRSKFWLYAVGGAAISALLDWPGYALALAAPGKIVFC